MYNKEFNQLRNNLDETHYFPNPLIIQRKAEIYETKTIRTIMYINCLGKP